MDTVTAIEPGIGGAGLLRLLAWLSPSFPVGAFSYSHGLEYAVEHAVVTDAETLEDWVGVIVAHGSGRVDAALFLATHDAVRARDADLAAWALEHGDAMRATREFGVEAEGQGRAFMEAVSKSWPAAGIGWLADAAARLDRPVVYPVAVGAAAAAHDLPARDALVGYLHAFAANIVSAGVRLIPLGQSDGLRVLAGLEPLILRAAAAALERPRADIGAATVMADWASASHETQYTRLFRS
ncbi:MAG: urease accessory protein UreF [Alphaproteobacteria bacterium]|nr:urease accessory protein UreF [Alphaproteobacteria bacterium]